MNRPPEPPQQPQQPRFEPTGMEAAVPTVQYNLPQQVGSPAALTMMPSGLVGAATSQLAYPGFQQSMYPTIGHTHQVGFAGFSPPPMIPMAAPQQLTPGQASGAPLIGAAGTSTTEVGKANPEMTEKQQKRKALMPFIIISLSYLLFTITDGSVRMIVLLHA
jgi:hypothetical protein